MPAIEESVKLDSYKLNVYDMIVNVEILKTETGYFHYNISIKNITETTNIILQKIREEFISKVNISGVVEEETGSVEAIKKRFKREILSLIKKYFPKTDKKTTDLLMNQIIRQNIGLGDIEILLKDANLEEIAINNSREQLWVYHKKYEWLITNIKIHDEERIRHN